MLIKKTLVALVAAALVLTSLPGCILDPKESVEEPKTPPVEWPDRTDKEDCIGIVDLVYKTEDIEKYKEVLLKPGILNQDQEDPGYIWYNQEEIVGTEIEGRTVPPAHYYTDEWQITERIFQNVVSLEFNFYPGTWDEFTDEFRNKPCDNCWITTRDYNYNVKFNDGMNYSGDYKVRWLVGPDPEDPDKFVIYQMEDLNKQAN